MDVYNRTRRALRRTAAAPAGLKRRVGPAELGVVIGPMVFFAAAVALLTFDHVEGRVSPLLFWLGLAVITVAFAWMLERTGRALKEIATERRDQMRDRATGLGNDEALHIDLAAVLESSEPTALFLVEVNVAEAEEPGGSRDSHAETMRKVADRLRTAAAALSGSAYRVEGARFAIAAPIAEGGVEAAIVSARAALGADLATSVHYGAVALPEEGSEPEDALRLADARLSGRKRRSLRSARRQVHSALMAALGTRRPELRRHIRSVLPKVIGIGRQLGLSDGELEDIVFAGGLQDIGLLSVPESILEKAGPLSESERALLQGHPIVGESIVAAAASLASVAPLVRASYERYDGSGYPDGLVGEEIPLGARIISPCVALAAMTADRPNRGPLSEREAVAELRANAGTQFDPRIVELLAADVEENSAPALSAVGTKADGITATTPGRMMPRDASDKSPRPV